MAERRGLGVAGKRGRKAWLKGVVLRRASCIEDMGHSVGLPEQGTGSVGLPSIRDRIFPRRVPSGRAGPRRVLSERAYGSCA